MLKILDRYILSEFFKLVLYSIVFVVFIYVTVNFFETTEEFIKHDADPYDVMLYYLFKIPQIFFLMIPYSVLLATAVVISSLSRNSELTAMRAGGMSLLSITSPILLASFSITLLTMFSNEYVIPYTNQKYYHIRNIKIFKREPASVIHENKIWYHSKDDYIWNIDYLDPKTNIFKGVHIYFQKDGQLLTKRLDASRATHDGKQWLFEDVYERRFNGLDQNEVKFFKKVQFQLKEIPSDFYRLRLNQKEMSIKDIHQYRKKLTKEGLDSTKYDVDFHYKISYPFVCFIMALIGIPFSLKSSRSGGIMFSVGLSTGIGWVYFYMFSMSISLGHEGLLPPLISAWGLNIIAMAIGFYMILTIDSDISSPLFKS